MAENEHSEADVEPTPTDEVGEAFAVDSLLEALRQARVAELILSTVTTLASVAYGKLEAREFADARLAIDAIGVLLPLLADAVEGDVVREIDQALATLRFAYADAVAAAQ